MPHRINKQVGHIAVPKANIHTILKRERDCMHSTHFGRLPVT